MITKKDLLKHVEKYSDDAEVIIEMIPTYKVKLVEPVNETDETVTSEV